MDISAVRELLQKWLSGNASEQEKKLVEDWYQNQLAQREFTWSESEKENMRAAIESKLLAEINKKPVPVEVIQPAKVRRLSWWTAAASVILLLGAGGYLYYHSIQKNTLRELTQQVAASDVAAPKNNRATITLANGQKIFLDSAANGTIAMQKNIAIRKSGDGIITYNGNEQPKTEIQYNTLSNPRGSKVIDITLSDGTQVWLNAESSLKYPVAFGGDERKVEITGEAYFEVKHMEKMPFIVKKNETEVQVLGTHFNVNAYDDESTINITLLQGLVKVSRGNNTELLHPGEQAQVSNQIVINKTIDTSAVMSWKNGRFAFSNTDIKTIMRQMARWYDVEVTYQDEIPDTYTVTVPRNVPVSQLFHYIQLSGGVHFDIDGKKITVRK